MIVSYSQSQIFFAQHELLWLLCSNMEKSFKHSVPDLMRINKQMRKWHADLLVELEEAR
jgi:hypothetical protein